MRSPKPAGALRTCAIVATVATFASLAGCSKSSSAPATPLNQTLNLSGTLSASGGTQSLKMFDPRGMLGFSRASTDFTGDSVVCATTDVPPTTITGTINADGTFALTIPAGTNKGLTCSVVDSSGSLLYSLVVSDSSKKDMNGNPLKNDHPAFNSTTTVLGTISLDPSGDATVTAADVVNGQGVSALGTSAATGTLIDPTGTYAIGDVSFTLPAGYRGTCTQTENQNNTCNGPPSGQVIYLNRLQGVSTADGSTIYGLQVWQDGGNNNSQPGKDPKSAMDLCGDMTGLTAAQATAAGVDFSSYGAKNGAFIFTTSLTDPNKNYPSSGTLVNGSGAFIPGSYSSTATIANGYQASTAYAQWQQSAGGSITVNINGVSTPAWYQGPDGSNLYSIGVGGGCVDASNNPVNTQNWPDPCTGGSGPTAMTNSTNGLYTNSCTGTLEVNEQSVNVTCTSTWGVYNQNAAHNGPDLTSPATQTFGGGATGPANFNWATVTVFAYTDELCSDITDASTQAQCYAQYYQQNIQGASGICLPKVQSNFSPGGAVTVFVDFRPDNMVFMDKLNYSSSAAASLLTEQDQFQGVQLNTGGNQNTWIPCAVHEKDGISFAEDATQAGVLIATFISSTTTSSTDPACQATYQGKVTKFLFTLTKQ